MKTAHLAPLAAVAALALLAACSSSRRAQAPAPTGQAATGTWQSAKVKPPKKPPLWERLGTGTARGPSEAKVADDKRLADKAARRAKAKADKAAERQARDTRRKAEREAEREARAQAAREADAAEARLAEEARREAAEREQSPAEARPTGKAREVVRVAETYLRTPYRFGGTSRAGMDCSGLLLVSFAEVGVQLPRTSAEQAKRGRRVEKQQLSVGDVVFFATAGAGRVSHAGLVVEARGGQVRFIHASTSAGVRIDELSNPYWAPRYLWGRRLLD